MKNKFTGCELLAESVSLLLNFSPKKTASLCGYKSKRSWLLAIEKAKKDIKKKKKKKPIALLCPASEHAASATPEIKPAESIKEQLSAEHITTF